MFDESAPAELPVRSFSLIQIARSEKFEVCNEPNLPSGRGSQADYFELYRQSAMAIKDVDKRLQVGGRSTA
jgi:Glycosyl hydrolases family 39